MNNMRFDISSLIMPSPQIPEELPFLKAICWQFESIKNFTPEEMLISYERGWRYLDVLGEPSLEELVFIKKLVQQYGSWLASNVWARFSSGIDVTVNPKVIVDKSAKIKRLKPLWSAIGVDYCADRINKQKLHGGGNHCRTKTNN